MKLEGIKINFLGDSITEGVGCTDAAHTFAALIAAEYGVVCRNYGVGGTRIARQSKPSLCVEHDQDFVSRVEGMAPDADVVAVFGGTNDFGHGDAPLGTMESRSVYTFYGALHTLYTQLIEKFPSSRIVVLTPLHRQDEKRLPDANAAQQKELTLLDYVRIIREVAEYYAFPVLDLYVCSGLQPQVPAIAERFVPDGLHPNDAGHRILARLIASFLERC